MAKNYLIQTILLFYVATVSSLEILFCVNPVMELHQLGLEIMCKKIQTGFMNGPGVQSIPCDNQLI